jgi:ATP-dependent Lhr-like helicase
MFVSDRSTDLPAGDDALSLFHPRIARWFSDSVGTPTDVQLRTWHQIACGGHVLATAPTGCGKTFAAFLYAVDRLVRGVWPTGQVCVLYVSPLKALNNDIRRNLVSPLIDLERVFGQAGERFPRIRVLTRSGDTPQAERRRMVHHPPEILITTPESLNILLNSAGGRSVLAPVRTVILDEIHAVVDSKRGVHLMAGVERLAHLAGEFQRIALSATIRPLETVARFVGGYRFEGGTYVARQVSVIESGVRKSTELSVDYPSVPADAPDADSIWPAVAAAVSRVVDRNRSTLVFTRTRRLCEQLTHLLNSSAQSTIAYAHHGSLSREIRTEVERRMKAGDLRAIVATNSLELGIDIGSIDEVVLIQSPSRLSSAVQRIGRSGHRVGDVSRGQFFATHGYDIIETAVVSQGVAFHDIEPLQPVTGALDVLAQFILSLATERTWDICELFQTVRTCTAFHDVSRREFDLVLSMLSGRYAGTRIRELKPRIAVDRIDNTIRARKGALAVLYSSGGTIPDRGVFHLRLSGSHALIGELDEEFVWEARRGQTFSLGTQAWRVERITHNDVFVTPGAPQAATAPFWRGEQADRDWHFSERVGAFLEDVSGQLDSPQLRERLCTTYRLGESAAEECIAFLRRQREHTGCEIPHRHHVLVEHLATGPGGVAGDCQIVLHTVWGGRVNRPFSLALQAAFEERFGSRPECFTADNAVYLFPRDDVSSEDLLSLVHSGNLVGLLRQTLEGSGYFGARFRECAGRALLLPRRPGGQRMPLWMNRRRSQRLLESVSRFEDFPILLETWRTCLRDEFDLESLGARLDELESGDICWTETAGITPSPFAATTSWQQINSYMYRDDTPESSGPSRLTDDLLREAVFDPALRPSVCSATVAAFVAKRQRLEPGYAPDSDGELVEWVKERLAVPWTEWQAMLDAIAADHGVDPRLDFAGSFPKLAVVSPGESDSCLVVAVEDVGRLRHVLWPNCVTSCLGDGALPKSAVECPVPIGDRGVAAMAMLGQWLQYYGPLNSEQIAQDLGLSRARVAVILEDLLDSGDIIAGALVSGSSETTICDAENFESLLRIERARRRPERAPRPVADLAPFFMRWQSIQQLEEGPGSVVAALERLECFPARADLWEKDILPAEDLDLFGTGVGGESSKGGNSTDSVRVVEALFPDSGGRYPFRDLLRHANAGPLAPSVSVGGTVCGESGEGSGTSPVSAEALSDLLWSAVWAGRVSNDAFAVLRSALAGGFKFSARVSGSGSVRGDSAANVPSARRRRRGSTSFGQWRRGLPFAGNWFLLQLPARAEDPIDRLEMEKERARLLLDRYGIVFRELTQRELPAMHWGSVFRALRLMELAGEVVSGCFFDGVPGPQFASRTAIATLAHEVTGAGVFWVNATDPASLCGLHLNGLDEGLPRRLPTTHIVYRGSELVLVSERLGKRLTFFGVDPADPELDDILAPLHHLLERSVMPKRSIKVESIDGVDAAASPFATALRKLFDADVDHRCIVLFRKPTGVRECR